MEIFFLIMAVPLGYLAYKVVGGTCFALLTNALFRVIFIAVVAIPLVCVFVWLVSVTVLEVQRNSMGQQCRNKLKYIGFACHAYLNSFGNGKYLPHANGLEFVEILYGYGLLDDGSILICTSTTFPSILIVEWIER